MALFHYNNLSKSSGIYVIFNSHNWRLYVGSTVRFKERWANGHFRSLLRGKHSNRFLQADFDKCKTLLGHDDFLEFHVLEHMPESTREQRLEVEEQWIKVHFDDGKQCYNLTNRAISREGFGSKNPEETRQKKSKAAKDFWASQTDDFKKQYHDTRRKTLQSKEHRDKVGKVSTICWSNEGRKSEYGRKIKEKWQDSKL